METSDKKPKATVIDFMAEVEKRRHKSKHANVAYLHNLAEKFAPALQFDEKGVTLNKHEIVVQPKQGEVK